MCGLAGYVREAPAPGDPRELARMLRQVRERGPDGEGVCLIRGAEGTWQGCRTDRSPPECGVLPHVDEVASGYRHDLALAHVRYAIIDLSAAAHQPFEDEAAGIVAAFQGEIFNYLELRAELERSGASFRTSSDTEVLVWALRAWGPDAWSRMNGFWAAAVYDARARRLVLSRDRLGIAPLYLHRREGGLRFGSSPLGVASMTAGGPRPRAERVRDFVDTGLRDFDRATLFEEVESLRPGTRLEVDFHAEGPTRFRSETYWEPPPRRLSERDWSLGEACGALRETLRSAVELRLRSDRPVAFQLSGGLDSTSVIAMAAELGAEPVPTYTVSVPPEDEEPFAATMAGRFRLERTILTDLGHGLLDGAVGLAGLMAEPVQAPSALAHHAMCARIAADGFGVVLSGSGGDESLAGYEWDFWPAAKRELRAAGLGLQARTYQAFLELGSPARARASLGYRLGRWREIAGRVRTRLPGRARRAASPSGGVPPEAMRTGHAPDPRGGARDLMRRVERMSYDEVRRHHLTAAHLPYYLASNDRATLGVPLEHRQPFLDHRVVELGLRLPPSYLFRRGWTKYALRRAMDGVLPRKILWRRDKVGFPFPLRPLIAPYRETLDAAADVCVERGLGPRQWSGVETECARDPRIAWRVCSVGLWLQALDETANPAPPSRQARTSAS